ncbi:MAG: hypothetical protein V4615_09155 [Bacteroidota bacterium]
MPPYKKKRKLDRRTGIDENDLLLYLDFTLFAIIFFLPPSFKRLDSYLQHNQPALADALIIAIILAPLLIIIYSIIKSDFSGYIRLAIRVVYLKNSL